MPDKIQLEAHEKETLTTALEAAVSVAPLQRTSSHDLFWQITNLYQSPDEAHKELRELLDAIKKIPALDLFEDARQNALGIFFDKVNFYSLIRWLVSRSQQVDATQAVDDLVKYLAAETLDVQVILGIDGFDVKDKIKVGGYELVPWKDVRSTDTKYNIAVRSIHERKYPTAAIILHKTITRRHIRFWDAEGYEVPLSIDPALDILRCIAAEIGVGFRILNLWLEPPDWAPWGTALIHFSVDSTGMLLHKTITAEDELQIDAIVSKLNVMSEIDKLRLRVPLNRLNQSYLAYPTPVNMAIELGIALESLYAPTKLSEGIGFAVRTRAARFLGGSIEERKILVKTLRDVYDLRSRAVHSGRLDSGDNPKKWIDQTKVFKTLDERQNLVGKSLIKLIKDGEPDWEEFDISGK
jgi:Apea-like HEPN